ncbi:rhodanese-like domain-containing protein [Croceiramulus getboli]|nr:rhodanese-like domain-containing protein [Flavobacteriaceae bacterium YJPT1-3]
MKDLSQQEWSDAVSSNAEAVIVDVRTPEEVEGGYIPNAIHIDIQQGPGFLDEVQKLDAAKPTYVYCRSGARSTQACQLMDQLGFDETYNLQGGILAWQGDLKTD